ncbi:CopD family protein [Halopseudomonas pachastrellae]|nr:CopD family protein [Halopseudomonas pachastrellae]
MYLWIKAFHIMAVITWLPTVLSTASVRLPRPGRRRCQPRALQDHGAQLLRGIMNPSMVVALLLGGWMLYLSPAWLSQGWMHAKLTLVALLVVYHHMCGRIRKRFAEDANTRSHVYYRWFNEAPVLALVGIVILVVVKPF